MKEKKYKDEKFDTAKVMWLESVKNSYLDLQKSMSVFVDRTIIFGMERGLKPKLRAPFLVNSLNILIRIRQVPS